MTTTVFAGAGACSLPARQADFRSNDPQERTLAVAQAARDPDGASVPQLIQMLQSSDAAERMLAITTLERITGETLGYEYSAPESARRAGVARWVAWQETGSGVAEPGRGAGSGGADDGFSIESAPASDAAGRR